MNKTLRDMLMIATIKAAGKKSWDELTYEERKPFLDTATYGSYRIPTKENPYTPSKSFAKWGGPLIQVLGAIAGASLLGPAIGGMFGAAAGTMGATIATAVGGTIGGVAGGLANNKIQKRYAEWLAGKDEGKLNTNEWPEFGGSFGSFSYPGLLDHTSMEGQRLDDLSVQSSIYGKMRPIVFNRKRLAGQLIWSRGLTDEKTTSTEADGHVTVTTWKYYLSALWEICENEDHRVTAVRQIYLDNKLVWDRSSEAASTIVTDPSFLEWTAGVPDNWTTSGTVAEVSTNLDPELTGAVAAAGIEYGGAIYQNITIATASVQHRITIRARSNVWTQVQVSVGGTTLPWLRCPGTGNWATIQTSWTPGATGSIELRISNLTTPSSTLVIGSVNVAVGVGDTGDEDPVDFEINLGDEDQAVPGVLADEHAWGADWTPAYVGAVTIGVSNLPLEKYGNHVPKLEAVVEEISQTNGDVVERIVRMVSPDTVVDVSELDQEIGGFFVNSRTSAEGAIDPLRLAYQFELLEDEDGVLVFRRVADRTSVMTVDTGLLDVRPFGTAPGALMSVSAPGDESLPNVVDVGFIEDDRNQEVGEARSSLFGISGNTSTSYNFPIVGTSDEFRSIAVRLHAIAMVERRTYSARADARLAVLEPTDLITVDGVEIRVKSITLDAFGRVTFSGVGHYGRAYTLNANGATVDVNLTIPAVGR